MRRPSGDDRIRRRNAFPCHAPRVNLVGFSVSSSRDLPPRPPNQRHGMTDRAAQTLKAEADVVRYSLDRHGLGARRHHVASDGMPHRRDDQGGRYPESEPAGPGADPASPHPSVGFVMTGRLTGRPG
jgi:hypothetical protein